MKSFVSLALLISAGLLGTVISCKKETDCKVVIRCVDSLSKPVAAANVLLYAPVRSPDGKTTYTADLKANGQTSSDGIVNFTFELPAIFDVEATKVVGTRTISGHGIVKLEEGKTAEEEVTLK
jgi:hypothetical protein